MREIKLKTKNIPTKITKDIWFYQNERSIHFVVWQTGRDGNKICVQFNLKLNKLTYANKTPKRQRGTKKKTELS
jgi:hypothetical protein